MAPTLLYLIFFSWYTNLKGPLSSADALDLSGIENAESWDQAALFRYRSRRDIDSHRYES